MSFIDIIIKTARIHERYKLGLGNGAYGPGDIGNSIRSTGGVVAVGRILRDFVADKPEQVADKPEQFEANDVEYWAMGVLTALDD